MEYFGEGKEETGKQPLPLRARSIAFRATPPTHLADIPKLHHLFGESENSTENAWGSIKASVCTQSRVAPVGNSGGISRGHSGAIDSHAPTVACLAGKQSTFTVSDQFVKTAGNR